jgi:hypothetical protein
MLRLEVWKLDAIMPLVTFIGGFFIVGFVLIIGGLMFGSKSTVAEGSKAVGQGCLLIIGVILFMVVIFSLIFQFE